MKNQKVVLAYRNKNEIKKGSIIAFSIILLIVALGLSSLFLLVNGKITDKLIGVAILFALLGILFVTYLKYINKQKRINSYPDEAIFYEDGCICIAEDEVIKIKCLNIKNIKAVDVSDNIQSPTTLTPEEMSLGYLVIKTNDNKKYKVEQIKYVKKVKAAIEDIRVSLLVEAEKQERIKEFEEKIEKARNDNNIKKMPVDNLLFVYDDSLYRYETITTISDIKVELSFFEGEEDDQNQSIKTIKTLLKDFDKFYKKVLKNLANDLIENANDWNDQEITKEEFINRINKKIIQISVTEEDYEIFFEDDGIFHGHTIVYYGVVDKEEFSTDIAG